MVATRPVDFRKGPDAPRCAGRCGSTAGSLFRRDLRVPGQAQRPDQARLVDGIGTVPDGQEAGDRRVQVAGDSRRRDAADGGAVGALLEGLDWRRVHGGRRPIAPQIAG